MTTWDEDKRRDNIAKHGVDLVLAADFDWETALVAEDRDAGASNGFGPLDGSAPAFTSSPIPNGPSMTKARWSLVRSACVTPRRRRNADMQKKSDPLNKAELDRVAARRAAVRARAEAALAAMTDKENDAVIAAANTDPDALPMTPADLDRLRPAVEVAPHLVAMQVRKGRPKSANRKEKLAIRLDPEVVDAWRASGPGWQTRMGDLLRRHAPK